MIAGTAIPRADRARYRVCGDRVTNAASFIAPPNANLYLWHDGLVYPAAIYGGLANRFNQGWWETRSEADAFYAAWLSGRDPDPPEDW